jgi:hypothetical protein
MEVRLLALPLDRFAASCKEYFVVNLTVTIHQTNPSPQVNKEEAARCRDIGADALRKNQFARAVKFLSKSLHLYPLPGVKPLLEQAERKLNESSSSSGPSSDTNMSTHNSQQQSTSNNNNTDANGRSYTAAQVEIVNTVLKARQGGKGAHYRILGLDQSADESAIKKAYRKLALKLHPDKNSAPHADEAFKAVGLAYATLSDSQKRSIYDRYGEEDPDQRGGGGMRHRGGGAHFHGQDVSPEDIFNMFFGGMPPGAAGGGFGGPGVRVYSTGFGPGFAFGGMHPNMARQRAQQQQQQQRQQQDPGLFGQFVQFLPLLMILFLSFFNLPGDTTGVGGSKYFSLTVSYACILLF